MYNDDEMKQPATKADIEKLETATREDIQRLEVATRADIQKLDLKVDGSINRLAKEIVRGQARVDASEKRILDQIRNFQSDILEVVDGFMGQVGKVDRRQIIVDHRIDRLEKRVDKIETRPQV